MNFQIDKKELLKGLSLVQSISGRKTTLPILTHVLFEGFNTSLHITGTDLEIGIREELSAEVQEEGKASVSAKKLYEIIKELPEGKIYFQKRENHWLKIQCGKSVFNLAGMDPDEFPSLPTYQAEHFSQISPLLLNGMIEKVAFAASNEESRYHLNGVLFLYKKHGGKGVLRMIATDGHRLSLIDREGEAIHGLEKGVIIPKKGVVEIKKVLSENSGQEGMGIYFNETHGFLKIGRSLIVIRLIDGEFPEYEQIIPKENDKKLTVDKEKIYGCLRRVSTMASERIEGVKLSFNNSLIEFSSYNQDFGDAKEELEVVYEGPSFEIGFNSRYLMEALGIMDSNEVVLELKDEGSPGVIRPSSLREGSEQFCIVMPMRI
jgi:DNA polymerase III subunit beta